ncbi:DUF3953 domain-containing protein [Gracilibacillus salinarum]|uniref:DUF3953 domain-containing protein n=1 Tax=Gracilibacillus salinarum TaxID=2932255 RepID=A0ABY4GHA6_9BACI|nr:DUF3953 domain-containing protein [Gracilibacillus salinarum]UOQ83534.1 DUF3953 domain-containing protein [Gracilibacillus salinarum]
MLLNIIIALSSIAVISGSIYSLLAGEYGIQPYLNLLLGLTILALGIKNFQKNRAIAAFCFLAAGFSLFVGTYML